MTILKHSILKVRMSGLKMSEDLLGFRSIVGQAQDPQLLNQSLFLSSETLHMTGIFRDINQDTEHKLKGCYIQKDK